MVWNFLKDKILFAIWGNSQYKNLWEWLQMQHILPNSFHNSFHIHLTITKKSQDDSRSNEKTCFPEKVETSWFEPYKTYIENYKLEWGAKIRKAFWIRHLFGVKEPNTAHNLFTQNPFLITASFLYFNGPMASFVATIATNKQIPCWLPMKSTEWIPTNRFTLYWPCFRVVWQFET